jgi:serine/threonine protein kinase
MTSISELEVLLAKAKNSPKAFFESDVDAVLRDVRVQSHPDRFSADADKSRAEEIFREFGLAADSLKIPPVTIRTPSRTYTVGELCAIGDVADVYHATNGSDEYLLKISRVPGGVPLMQHEFEILKELDNVGTMASTYRKYFPHAVETMRAKDKIQKQVTAFSQVPGDKFYTLEQVRDRYPDGVDGRHLGWMYKRILEGLGYAHHKGIVHNATLPDNVIIMPSCHGVKLLDWKTATKGSEVLKVISGKYKNRGMYPEEVSQKKPTSPATDIYMATKCMVYLARDSKGQFPSTLSCRIVGYFRSATIERQSMRPQDAWDYHEEFGEVLRSVYGPPKFYEFVM